MRNLTIKRNKRTAASLIKAKVYIEDNFSSELTINGVPCRKIGELKNGEEKTFQIGEEEAKVFVIADKLSKDYCNDFYQLPSGMEDISLSGNNILNPAAGNPFRFDNNTSAGVEENRKKGAKKRHNSGGCCFCCRCYHRYCNCCHSIFGKAKSFYL